MLAAALELDRDDFARAEESRCCECPRTSALPRPPIAMIRSPGRSRPRRRRCRPRRVRPPAGARLAVDARRMPRRSRSRAGNWRPGPASTIRKRCQTGLAWKLAARCFGRELQPFGRRGSRRSCRRRTGRSRQAAASRPSSACPACRSSRSSSCPKPIEKVSALPRTSGRRDNGRARGRRPAARARRKAIRISQMRRLRKHQAQRSSIMRGRLVRASRGRSRARRRWIAGAPLSLP